MSDDYWGCQYCGHLFPTLLRLDAGRHQEIGARNEADTAIHLAERVLTLRREELTPDIAATVESKVARLRAALRGGSVVRIQLATQELRAALPAAFLDEAAQPPDAEAGSKAPVVVPGSLRD